MPDREKVIEALDHCMETKCKGCPYLHEESGPMCYDTLMGDAAELLKAQEPDASKYQYKYDHTDCIWYHDSRSKCPVTCSQYRDGWNDAMDFIFKNGAGYSPYERRVSDG